MDRVGWHGGRLPIATASYYQCKRHAVRGDGVATTWESFLDLGCGETVVVLQAIDTLNGQLGAIVGIDNAHLMLQQSRRLWENRGLGDIINLYHGYVRRLHTIANFHGAFGQPRRTFTFDVVFARDVFPALPTNDKLAALQHWAAYRTSGTGRMVVTFRMGEPVEHQYAGLVTADSEGCIFAR